MSPFKSPEPKPSSFVKKFTRPNAAWSQPEAAAAYLKWEHEQELRIEREELERRTLARQKKAAAEERAQRKAAASASSSKTISSANRRELQAALDVLEGVKKSGGGYSALCPAHDDTRPSLSISLGDGGRLLAHCFADCSFEEIMTAIRERQREVGASADAPAVRVDVDPRERADAERNSKIALRIWRETIPADNLIQAYFRERGITLPPPECLRSHEWLRHPDGWFGPAMVAAVQNVHGEIVAVHRTFFKPHLVTDKLMLGPCKGGAVRLGPVAKKIAVAEGIETGLSVMQSTGLPTWAALSTSGIKNIVLPDEVHEVVIAADGDGPGRTAARALAARLVCEGRIARIMQAPDKKDWNDVLREGLRKRRPAKKRARIERAMR